MEDRNLKYAKILAKLIQADTVSEDGNRDRTKFLAFHELLKETFPNIFSACEFENIDGAILMRWPADSNVPAAEAAKIKKPFMFMNHQDVVPASGKWEHDPFSGDIVDGKIWGRGVTDDKGGLFGMLQAADELAAEGFKPNRDIYFESSCTEETSGETADQVAKELEKRGIYFDLILDEGGVILYDPIGGADGTFAMIGTGEKGCTDLKIIAKSNGGHASMPGKNTPLVRLGKFMAAADKANLFDVQITPVVKEMFSRIAPSMKGATKFLLSHVSAFSWLLKKVLPALSSSAGAMLKTTLAFTMASGADATNVIPAEAYVIGNMRFSHHQGRESSIQAVTEFAKKYDLEVEVVDPGVTSPLCDYNCDSFKLLERGVREVFEDVIPTPYLMTGASDSRFFGNVSDKCFRFLPFKVSDEQLSSMHGINENLDIDTLAPAVDFYKYIMKES